MKCYNCHILLAVDMAGVACQGLGGGGVVCVCVCVCVCVREREQACMQRKGYFNNGVVTGVIL